MRKIWDSFIIYLTKDKETEIKLFKILGLSGILVSIVSGIQSIATGISISGGLIDFGAAVLSVLLMWFVDRTHKYVVGYILTEVGVFMALFGMLYFEMGGMSGSMTYFFSFGLVFTFLMFRGKLLIVMESLQVAVYLFIILFSVRFPEKVTPFADYKSQLIDQLVGIILSGVGIGLIFMVYIYQLEKLQKVAQEASRAKSNFLANLSHELRTPINIMLGINEMIGREAKEESIQEYTRKAAIAGNQLMSEVNQLLEFSKIDAGKNELKNSCYSIYDLINSLKVFYEKEAEKKGISFSTEIDERIEGNMLGDVQKITQILTNLLSNAIKYTHKGSVTLKVKLLESKENVRLLYFEVKDTGIGIRDEEKDRIFDVFERADINNNRNIEGTGLGLTIAQTFVMALGGKIEVESRYHEGSRFFFSIEQEPAGKGSVNVNPGYYSVRIAPKAKLLIVDDNEMNLEVVKSLLKRTLINVSLAGSGDECLEKLKKEHFDIVILDYMMPGKDGLTTIKEIRQYIGKDLPVIALTADATEERRSVLLEAGFDACLTKPVDSIEIENAIFDKLPPNIVEENQNYTNNIERVRFVENMAKEIAHYNIDLFEGLKHFGNNLEQYIEVAAVFKKGSRLVLAELEELHKAGDYEKLIHKVHSLKGNSGNIGATELLNLASGAEEHLRNGDYDYYKASGEFLLFMYYRALEGISVLLNRYDENNFNGDNQEQKTDEYGPDDAKSLLYDALEYILRGEPAPAIRALEYSERALGAGYKEDILAVKEEVFAIEFESAEEKLNAVIEKLN